MKEKPLPKQVLIMRIIWQNILPEIAHFHKQMWKWNPHTQIRHRNVHSTCLGMRVELSGYREVQTAGWAQEMMVTSRVYHQTLYTLQSLGAWNGSLPFCKSSRSGTDSRRPNESSRILHGVREPCSLSWGDFSSCPGPVQYSGGYFYSTEPYGVISP